MSTRVFVPFEYQESVDPYNIRLAIRSDRHSRSKHKIFLPDVHNLRVGQPGAFMWPSVRLLFRPFGEGKSTELNFIKVLFESLNVREKKIVALNFDEAWRSRRREDLFQCLKAKLGLRKPRSFWQLFNQLDSDAHRVYLLLADNLENLSDDCITWFVHTMHELERRQDSAGKYPNVYVAASGSFGLGDISQELFPVFHPQEISFRIRDYTFDHLTQISEDLKRMMEVRLSSELSKQVGEFTAGDKRVVNMLLNLALESAVAEGDGKVADRELSPEHFEGALRYYFDVDFRNDRRVQRVLMVANRRDIIRYLRILVTRGSLSWSSVPPDVHRILYNYGLISIEGGDTFFRSSFIERVVRRALNDVRKVAAFIEEYIPKGRALPQPVRNRRSRIARFLEERSFRGILLWIYYGEILSISVHDADVELTDWEGNQFLVTLPLAEFGKRLRPGSGFLRYKVLSDGAISEEWFFYGAETNTAQARDL